ncbi:MAG: phosphodiester glycosidase family protein [Gemmatimonadetes bacterium]|nr:phosphodiester glycosidase family protein [Gemmatimonadota bacterium]
MGPGLHLARARLRGSGEAFRTDLYVVRINPDSVQLTLDTAFQRGARAWTLDRASPRAALAVNAGQFVADQPWGWVQLDGRTYLPPARGPLVTTVAIGADGRMALHHGATLPPSGASRWAFQSYPTLLAAGAVPAPLRFAGQGIDVGHRDARLAIGTRCDGTVVIAMTRFGMLGEALGRLPFGLTTPEMAAVMGLLGTRDAVLLDGGISAQLLVRGGEEPATRLPGLRAVPLGLVGYMRVSEVLSK